MCMLYAYVCDTVVVHVVRYVLRPPTPTCAYSACPTTTSSSSVLRTRSSDSRLIQILQLLGLLTPSLMPPFDCTFGYS